jgi:putative flippase GtrA
MRCEERRRLVSFGVVGVCVTLVYAGLAGLFASAGLEPVSASALAYACSAVLSYTAHKRATFRSKGPHAVEAPRFLLTFAIGSALAVALPAALTRVLELPPAYATATVCVAVPVANYVALRRFVFR